MTWLIYVFYYLFHVIESSLGTWGLGHKSPLFPHTVPGIQQAQGK